MTRNLVARLRRLAPLMGWSLLIGSVSLSFAVAQEGAEKKVEEKKAEEKKAARPKRERPKLEDTQWGKMDYGTFLMASVGQPMPGTGNNADKGVVVKVGDSAICFDTDLLRVSSGWSGRISEPARHSVRRKPRLLALRQGDADLRDQTGTGLGEGG